MRKTFTLIETLVAISICLSVIGFIVSSLSRYLSAHQTINNQLIASYLAQEAIEKIRSLRDTNWLRNRPWNFGIQEAISTCFDYRSTNFPGCNFDCSPLKLSTSGFYICSTDSNLTPTPFTRTISVKLNQNNEMTISVRVSWQERTGQRQIEVLEKLYNWLSP